MVGPSRSISIGAIALAPHTQLTPEVEACFENLLPEGEVRDYLAKRHQTSTVFGLLRALAGDTAGGLLLLPPGQKPLPPSCVETTWETIAASLTKPGASAVDLHAHGARISLAGAQDKTTLAVFDGMPMLPEGNSPSTHILKPDIYRLKKVWESAANEVIVMRTARHCGLSVAPVFYEPHTRSCVVERFDRYLVAPREPLRLLQYDFCQLAGIPSDQAGGHGMSCSCCKMGSKAGSLPSRTVKGADGSKRFPSARPWMISH